MMTITVPIYAMVYTPMVALLATGDTASWASVAVTLLGFLTLIATRYYDNQKVERQRQWDIEDREATAKALASKTAAEALAIKQEVKRSAETVACSATAHADEIKAKVDANTEISVKAFTEANNVNQKLERLGVKIAQKNDDADVIVKP